MGKMGSFAENKMAKKYRVQLEAEERERLEQLIAARNGKKPAGEAGLCFAGRR